MNLNKRDKVLLSVLGVLLAVGGMYWFVVKPAKAEVASHQATLEVLEADTGALRDQLSRLAKERNGEQNRMVEGFALAKAVPNRPQVASAVIQLQGLAQRSNVALSGVRTTNVTDYGGITATEMTVEVIGRYFDISDFMFRMHNQVTVDDQQRPAVKGRLFATKGFEMTLVGDTDQQPKKVAHAVRQKLTVLVFTRTPAVAAVPLTPAASPMMSPKAAEQQSINAINATNANGGTP